MENKSLNAALAKTQGEIKSAKKSAENPFFKSNYADLAECIDAIQSAASKNGLSVIFDYKTEFVAENPANFVRYILSHESGEQFQSQWILMLMKDKTPQGFGASCTYYRRQLLKSIYQISESDDDGNSQSQSVNEPPPFQQRQVKNFAPQSRKV